MFRLIHRIGRAWVRLHGRCVNTLYWMDKGHDLPCAWDLAGKTMPN